MTPSTRTRLLDAALTLFAEHGYSGTSVGQIEAAAGLTERGGAAYKHFRSKREIFNAAIERQIEQILEMRAAITGMLPLGDARADLVLIARWILAELGREQMINALMEKDPEVAVHLRQQFLSDVVQPGYTATAEVLRERMAELGLGPAADTDGLAAVAVGALVNYRRHEWTFGSKPLDIDEDRYVEALVNLIVPKASQGPARPIPHEGA